MKHEDYAIENTESIITPALVYYKEIIEANVQTAISLAGNVERLWPHVKTHKSADMVSLLINRGIHRFKCATIAEAEMAAACGADFVIVSYPLVGPNIYRFIRLIEAFPKTRFYAIADDKHQVGLLSNAATNAEVQASLLIDVNTGLNRTGVLIKDVYGLYQATLQMSGIRACGLHVYDGHRHESDLFERQRNVDQDVALIRSLRNRLVSEGFDCSIVVVGGSPSFPCHSKYPDVFLSPGTCLIQDWGYANTFSDLPFQIGAMILTRVISHPALGLFTVDLGYKSVAADPEQPRAVLIGYEDAITIMQNEEHWVLRMCEGREQDRPDIGEVLYAAPKHICPTSALYPSILVAKSGVIETEWMVTARNRVISI